MRLTCLATLALTFLVGCQAAHGPRRGRLVPAPALTPSEVLIQPSSPETSLIYVTDRADLRPDDPARAYGWERGDAVRVGTARVSLGRGRTQEELAHRTSTPGSAQSWPLRVEGVIEHGTLGDGSLEDQVRARLAGIGHGDVVLAIHGIGTGFAESLFPLAQIWHHLGRRGVPIAYAWPSGKAGFIQNVYQYERDSGDFTVPTLEQVLIILAAMPEVDRIHVVAHSRGTAVLADALRAVRFKVLATGAPLTSLRIGTLVLAAPDFDIPLFERDVVEEGLLDLAEHTLMLVSDRNFQLMASGWMHGGPRVGGAPLEAVAHLAAGHDRFTILDCSTFRSGGRRDHYVRAPEAFAAVLRALARPPAAPDKEGGS